MRIRTNVWIENAEGEVVFGLGRQRILEAIQECGSLKAAAEKLGFSYRGLWARLRLSEKRLGFPLVDSHPGRGEHAGTKLTPRALELLERYRRALREIYDASDRAHSEHIEEMFGTRKAD